MRGVLWDLDGVLVDTGEFHFQAWSAIFSERGIPFGRDLFRRTFGMNNAGVLRMVLGPAYKPELADEIAGEKEQSFRQAIRGHLHLLPGVQPWLEGLQARGTRQAIASSAPPANIETIVDELGVRDYFHAVVSGDDLPGKPDPAIYLRTAQRIEISPERCIVIEDAVAGVEGARRAGMKCIAVTTTHPSQALQAADIVVDRLDQLPVDTAERLVPDQPSTDS